MKITFCNRSKLEVIPIIFKRTVSKILALTLCLSILPLTAVTASAKDTWITDSTAVNGSDFTTSPALAEKLDEVFEGNAGVYRDLACTNLVDTELGTRSVRNNGIYLFVDPVNGVANNIGTSCWIYANGVYCTLFGESTGKGVGENSEKLSLSGTGSRSLTYDNLKAWGVRPGVGALIRASNHSMILLGYDENTLTVLDGNGDGQGLVAIRQRSWKDCGGWVEYIIQPKDAHYADLFAWGMCGESATWSVDEAGTLTIAGSGSITYPGWREYMDDINKVIIAGRHMQIGNGVFYNCTNLEEIVFQGEAPAFDENALLGVEVPVLYPAPEAGWHKDLLKTYGGTPEWIPYGMTQLRITAQPQSVCAAAGEYAEISVAAEGDGLSYCWYMKKPGESVYVKSSVSSPVYTATMTELFEDMQVVCVVVDQYGNFLTSQHAFLRMCSDGHPGTAHPEPAMEIPDVPYLL